MKELLKFIVIKYYFGSKEKLILFYAFYLDFKKYLQHSLITPKPTKEYAHARMMLLSHALEKGLSFEPAKIGFGKGKSEELFKIVSNFLKTNPNDEISTIALSVLDKYINNINSGSNKEFEIKVKSIINKARNREIENIGGTKEISLKSLPFVNTFDNLYQIAFSRASVRDFSSQEINSNEIDNAVKYAQTAPSVCNRQSSRIHIFKGEIMKAILENQLGDQGWANKANKLIIITSDLNFFGSVYERNQSFIDGGMFAMQFVMGLHSQKIASCCKMYIRTPSIDKDFYKLTRISENEVPIMLILAGHYKDAAIKVPYSYRLPINKILLIHE